MVEAWAAGHGSSEWGENKPQGGLVCEEGPEEWARGMFKGNGGVKFSAGPSLVTRRFCDEKVQGHFGWNERAGGEVMGNQAQ